VRQARRGWAAAWLVAAIIAIGCGTAAPTPTPTPSPTPADGGTTHLLETADGQTLTARRWQVDTDRVAIYLHEYREDQSSWQPFASMPRRLPASAITFDFRGHGVSTGLPDDVEGMIQDARTVLEFARERGYTQIMLVGAGMGAAIAVLVAADHPDVHVIGLSTPSAFDVLDTLAAIPALEGRIALAASADDLSAAHSFGELAEAAATPEHRARLYEGRAHGVNMLRAESGAVATEFVEDLLVAFWPPPPESLR
jgi:pimeloyl-ACP methyl ester carboxylesterase